MTRSVVFYTDSDAVGGAEGAMLALAAGLDRNRWAPKLLRADTKALEPLDDRALELGVPVVKVPPMPLGPGGARRVTPFARRLAAQRPDVFHAHLSWPLAAKWALVAAAVARVPAVLATVQLFPEFRPSHAASLQQRVLASAVHRYVAVSQQTAARLQGAFGWPDRKLEVIRNGVDPGRFRGRRDARLRTVFAGPDGSPVLLALGRLHEQKRLEDLLTAAAELPGVRVAIAGDGPERKTLERRAQALGIAGRTTFLGARRDVPELLAAADVFVLPSVYEGTSLAILEAMAAGRPIVTTRIGGTDELVRDGETALLVPPRHPAALRAGLARMLEEPELAARLGAAARARAVRCFSQAAVVGRTDALYEELLARA